jgi:predicted component of type VI protein secretion system
MEAKLLIVKGGKLGKDSIPFTTPAVLGRSREVDVTLAHPMISRRHCEIIEQDGLLLVRDFASLNGTRINGYRVKEAALAPGAEFSIGPLTFRMQYEYAGDLSAVPEPVFDRSTADGSATPDGDMPDFEPMDPMESLPDVPPIAPPAPSPKAAPKAAAKPSAGEGHDDDFAIFGDAISEALPSLKAPGEVGAGAGAADPDLMNSTGEIEFPDFQDTDASAPAPPAPKPAKNSGTKR